MEGERTQNRHTHSLSSSDPEMGDISSFPIPLERPESCSHLELKGGLGNMVDHVLSYNLVIMKEKKNNHILMAPHGLCHTFRKIKSYSYPIVWEPMSYLLLSACYACEIL